MQRLHLIDQVTLLGGRYSSYSLRLQILAKFGDFQLRVLKIEEWSPAELHSINSARTHFACFDCRQNIHFKIQCVCIRLQFTNLGLTILLLRCRSLRSYILQTDLSEMFNYISACFIGPVIHLRDCHVGEWNLLRLVHD